MIGFSTISYVTSGFTLVAFVVAAIVYAYGARLRQRAKIIKQAPPNDRLAIVEATAELIHVDLTGLRSTEKTRIILEQLRIKRNREIMVAVVMLFIALIAGIVTVIEITQNNTPTIHSANIPPPAPEPTDKPNPAVPAPAQPAPAAAPAAPRATFLICHGQYEVRCKANSYVIFEECSDANGVGGADPSATAQRLCGNLKYKARQLASPIGGNHCGYSWFAIDCY